MNILYIGLGIFATLYVKDEKFRSEANKTVNDIVVKVKEAINDDRGSK